jgi:hypothetical protein
VTVKSKDEPVLEDEPTVEPEPQPVSVQPRRCACGNRVIEGG